MTKTQIDINRKLKLRIIKKNEARTIARKSCITSLNTKIKNFYGMLKSYIDTILASNTNAENKKQVKNISQTMLSQHIHVFSRTASHQTCTPEEVNAYLNEIHAYAQSLVSKKVLVSNQASNLISKISQIYKKLMLLYYNITKE